MYKVFDKADMAHIPPELAELPHWTWGRMTETGDPERRWYKIPFDKVGTEKTGRTLVDVCGHEQPMVVFSELMPLVVVDIDKSFDVPARLPATYTETSPSGTGLHLYYMLSDASCKAYGTTGKYNGKIDGHDVEVFVRSGCVTVTGRKLEGSPDDCTVLTQAAWSNILLALSEGKRNPTAPAVDRSRVVPSPPPPRSAGWEDEPEDGMPTFASYDALVDGYGAITPSTDRILLADVCEALADIPANGGDREFKDLYLEKMGRAYHHYAFWVEIGMAIKSAFPDSGGFGIWVAWSAADTAHFHGDGDCATHWRSFTPYNPDEPFSSLISSKLLFFLAKRYPTPVFPKMMTSGRKGEEVEYPDPLSAKNLRYLASFYSMAGFFGRSGFYMSTMYPQARACFGETTLFRGLYGAIPEDMLHNRMIEFIQEVFPVQSRGSNADRAYKMLLTEVMSNGSGHTLFSRWLDGDAPLTNSPGQVFESADWPSKYSAETPPPPTWDTLLDCFEWDANQDVELARACIKACIYMVIRQNCFKIEAGDVEGMLILVGGQGIGKSQFSNALVPLALKDELVGSFREKVDGAKSQRDFIRAMVQTPFLVLDEVEGILDLYENGSQIKNLISAIHLDYTEIYKTNSIRAQRRALLIGSTNSSFVKIPEGGSRKIWPVIVRRINSQDLNFMNWHAFYNMARKEFVEKVDAGEQPWMLPRYLLPRLEAHNQRLSAKNSTALDIDEACEGHIDKEYLFKIKDYSRSPFVMSLKGVKDKLRARGVAERELESARLRRAITEYAQQLWGACSFTLNASGTVVYSMGSIKLTRGNTVVEKFLLPPSPEEWELGQWMSTMDADTAGEAVSMRKQREAEELIQDLQAEDNALEEVQVTEYHRLAEAGEIDESPF